MSHVILIDQQQGLFRVAQWQRGQLQDLLLKDSKQSGAFNVSSPNKEGSKGQLNDIYRAKVKKIIPKMQMAFVELMGGENGFLNFNTATSLKKGDFVLVQIDRESIGDKAARIRRKIRFLGHYLVYLGEERKEVFISRRLKISLSSKEKQQKLQSWGKDIQKKYGGGSIILRQSCKDSCKKEIEKEFLQLKNLEKSVREKFKKEKGVQCLYRDPEPELQFLRDLCAPQMKALYVEGKEPYAKVKSFLETLMPFYLSKLQAYKKSTPLFKKYSLEEPIKTLYDKKVTLKSGAYIYIEETEALTSIDVNSGSYRGSETQEKSLLKVNLEACKTIAIQLKLRNIGGVVVVDFIDLKSEKYQMKLLSTFGSELEKDKNNVQLLKEISPFGLVQLVRKCYGPSLSDTLKKGK